MISDKIISAKAASDALADPFVMNGRIQATLRSSGKPVDVRALSDAESARNEINAVRQGQLENQHLMAYCNTFFGVLSDIDVEPRLYFAFEQMLMPLSVVHQNRPPLVEPFTAFVVRCVLRALQLLNETRIHRQVRVASLVLRRRRLSSRSAPCACRFRRPRSCSRPTGR